MKTVRGVQIEKYNELTTVQKTVVDLFEKSNTANVFNDGDKSAVDVSNELAAVLNLQLHVVKLVDVTDFSIVGGIVPMWAVIAKMQPTLLMFEFPNMVEFTPENEKLVKGWLDFTNSGTLIGTLRGGKSYVVAGKSMFVLSAKKKEVQTIKVKEKAKVETVNTDEVKKEAFVRTIEGYVPHIKSTKLFARTECSRCDGSGQHQFNMRTGRTCFKCLGDGKQWAKADAKLACAYSGAYASARKPEVSNIVVGDVINANDGVDTTWHEVVAITKLADSYKLDYATGEYVTIRENAILVAQVSRANLLRQMPTGKVKRDIIKRLEEYSA